MAFVSQHLLLVKEEEDKYLRRVNYDCLISRSLKLHDCQGKKQDKENHSLIRLLHHPANCTIGKLQFSKRLFKFPAVSNKTVSKHCNTKITWRVALFLSSYAEYETSDDTIASWW